MTKIIDENQFSCLEINSKTKYEYDKVFDLIIIPEYDKKSIVKLKKKLSPYSYSQRVQELDYLSRSVANHYWIIFKKVSDENLIELNNEWDTVLDNIVLYKTRDSIYDKVYEDMHKTVFSFNMDYAENDIKNVLKDVYKESTKESTKKYKRYFAWVTNLFANLEELRHDKDKGSKMSEIIFNEIFGEKAKYRKEIELMAHFRDLLYHLCFMNYNNNHNILLEANKLNHKLSQF